LGTVAGEPVDDAAADPRRAVRVAIVGDGDRDAAVALEVARLARVLAGEEGDAAVLDSDPDRHRVGRPVRKQRGEVGEVAPAKQFLHLEG
jgi:hypothetical protein